MEEVCLEKEEFDAFLRLVHQAVLLLEIMEEKSHESTKKRK